MGQVLRGRGCLPTDSLYVHSRHFSPHPRKHRTRHSFRTCSVRALSPPVEEKDPWSQQRHKVLIMQGNSGSISRTTGLGKRPHIHHYHRCCHMLAQTIRTCSSVARVVGLCCQGDWEVVRQSVRRWSVDGKGRAR